MKQRTGLKLGALLSLTLALTLPAYPAQADFFEDLSFAVNKLGDAVGDAVTDTAKSVDGAISQDSHNHTAPPPDEAGSKSIVWNTSPGYVTSPNSIPRVPPPRPTDRSSSSRGSALNDDAPAPRAAPQRRPVSVVEALPALPGTLEASTPLPRPSYMPASMSSMHGIANSASALPQIRPTAARPERPLADSFKLRFESRQIEIADHSTAAPATAKPVLQEVAARLKNGLNLRLALTAHADTREGQMAQARQRSFARATALKTWLTQQGIRPTQIDMKVELAPTDNGPVDRVDLVIVPDL